MRRWASTWAVRHLSTVGNHGAARQRGRAAARAAAAAAHQHKQDGADEGSTTATRLGFSSSHGSRTYHPEHITTPTSSSSPSAAETMHPMQPLVEPSSEWAYRHRLEQGRMGSLLELVLSPYAPGGLQVLADVLQHIQQRKQMMAMGNGANDASSVSVEGLRGCTLALSSRLELAQVMRRAAHEVREVVEAADVVGDRLSMRELQQKAEEVERLAAQLTAFMSSSTAAPDAWPTGSDDEGALVSTDASSADALREWRLSDAVHAEFLRGLLRIGEELGASTMAADVLEQLIELSSRHALLQERATARGAAPHEDDVDGDDECFSLDTVVASVEAEVEAKVGPTTATDHLSAMGSCVHARNFDLALALYRRLLLHAERGVFVLQPADLSRALTHLAHSCRHAPHFGELQRLLQESEVAAAVPVSEPFYTSLVDALSRAEGYPQRMAMALALYRRLRDANIAPTVSTYAALMACCAAEREPTHAFALFHEARSLCGVAALSPAIYANLMMSYVKAGYGADARRTLDVLVEAGAPLTRTAFHAALAGAVSPREAQEILTMMENTYRIAPTPHTFSFMVHAAAKVPSGVSTALALFDLHERCLGALLEEGAVAGESSAHSPQHIAASSTTGAVELDRLLLDRYPLYVRAVEHALMKLRIDPMMDPRLGKYLQPLLRVAQRRMNAFTEMPPQAPTRIPAGEHTCIAVLGADVLANVDELVLPFLEHYSAVVIPYSSLLALQMGSGRRVEGLSAKGNRAALFDPVWMEAGDEHGAMVEHRRRRLVSFLKTYADVVHLMSLEEEMQWARDTRRYGIAATNWFARCAAVAIQLARTDTRQGTKVYANHPTATIVLVSASYHRCGRFVVDLRRELLSPTSLKKDGQQLDGLRSALRRVVFHNPATQPDWVPPTLAMQRRQEQEHEPREDAEAEASPPHYVETLPSTAATRLYREKLLRASTSATMVAKSSPEQTSRQEEEVLDAEMLMDLLGMDDA